VKAIQASGLARLCVVLLAAAALYHTSSSPPYAALRPEIDRFASNVAQLQQLKLAGQSCQGLQQIDCAGMLHFITPHSAPMMHVSVGTAGGKAKAWTKLHIASICMLKLSLTSIVLTDIPETDETHYSVTIGITVTKCSSLRRH
jgi:hypothetical protein